MVLRFASMTYKFYRIWENQASAHRNSNLLFHQEIICQTNELTCSTVCFGYTLQVCFFDPVESTSGVLVFRYSLSSQSWVIHNGWLMYFCMWVWIKPTKWNLWPSIILIGTTSKLNSPSFPTNCSCYYHVQCYIPSQIKVS